MNSSDDILDDEVLVSKRLGDKNQSLGLGRETKSLGTLKTFASVIYLFSISIAVNLSIACTD